MTVIEVIIVEKPFIIDRKNIEILNAQLERISSDKTIAKGIVKTYTYTSFLKYLM